jgi:glycosyltransferase involved in cell wall biosynthesis
MKNSPLVSIIIPCYNHARFLSEAIESALAQNYEPVEVIVIEDGSTDDSAHVAGTFKDRGIRVVSKENAGLSEARNMGAKEAKGKYLIFLDADDRLEPSYASETVALLEQDPSLAFVYTQMRLFGNEIGVTDHPDYDLARLKQGNYINATATFRRSVFEHASFDPAFRGGWEDWDFFLTLAEQEKRGKLLDKPLLNYRKHESGSMTNLLLEQQRRAGLLRRLYTKHRQLYGPLEKLRWELKLIGYQIPGVYPLYAKLRGRG